jgi:L-cysteate sulfo-lyase
MIGLIALAKMGALRGETVVFLHSGGALGLFGYESVVGVGL